MSDKGLQCRTKPVKIKNHFFYNVLLCPFFARFLRHLPTMNANPEEELLTEKMSFRCRPSLKNAIQNAARLVKRKPAAWIVIELEKIIERQSKLTAHTPRKGGEPSETTRLGAFVGGWKRNALRHSFISYRAAQAGLGQTAMEAGNSESEAKASYLDAMTEAESELWFRLPAALQARLPATPLRVVDQTQPTTRRASTRSA
jgi:hypothetical protein